MQTRAMLRLLMLSSLVAVAACSQSKSENPLSPTVAGPIAGVNITAPTLIQPSAGSRIADSEQPVTLTVGNAQTNGQRPLSYVFEVATDTAFTTKVFTRSGVEQNSTGKTAVTLPSALESGRSYYWRAQAVDGANSGPFAATAKFDVYTPVKFDPPTPLSPADGVTVSSNRPTLVVRNATRTGTPGAVTYTFQVSESTSFQTVNRDVSIGEQGGQTEYTTATDLTPARTFYWRVRAADPTTTGPWSATRSFKTPGAGPSVPTPPPTNPGSISGDDVDPSTFSWNSVIIPAFNQQDIASWARTATPGTVYAHNPDILFESDRYQDWINRAVFGDDVSYGAWGNIWIVFKMNGRTYASTFQWMHGLDGNRSVIREEYRYTFSGTEPLTSWEGPRDGQLIGLFVSTRARFEGPPNDVRERSPIVWVRYNTNSVVGYER